MGVGKISFIIYKYISLGREWLAYLSRKEHPEYSFDMVEAESPAWAIPLISDNIQISVLKLGTNNACSRN